MFVENRSRISGRSSCGTVSHISVNLVGKLRHLLISARRQKQRSCPAGALRSPTSHQHVEPFRLIHRPADIRDSFACELAVNIRVPPQKPGNEQGRILQFERMGGGECRGESGRGGIARAPMAGKVNRVLVTGVGGSISAGIGEIVPSVDTLSIEVMIRPSDIAIVRLANAPGSRSPLTMPPSLATSRIGLRPSHPMRC